MKRIHYFLVLLCFVFATNSCEENGIFFPPSENNAFFEVIIDGELFTTTEANFTTDGDHIAINAIKTDSGEVFTLSVEGFAIGSFSLEGINNTASYIQNDPVSAGVWTTFGETSSRGNITFTDINFVNNTVSGTFSFIGKNDVLESSKAFSNGSFSNIPISTQPVFEDSFAAKVDGVVYQEISLFASSITIGTKNLININANKTLTETITFNFNETITPGEYDFGSFSNQTYPTGSYTDDLGNTYEAVGKITITSHDTSAKIISGTFNFNATPVASTTVAHAITEGSFRVSY
ncbi:DUF6252 family protein [Polaribacter sp. R77954]|uniref:DUF6252 family protein n=1 Tax=Polaribacter sp. R77954 TaxID=3093870 RepID=UPI0037CBA589